jgi:hypothetical protein
MVKKLEIDALLFMIVGAFVGMFLVVYVKHQPVRFYSDAAAPVAAELPTTAPTPTVSFQTTTTTSSQISSDGTHKVNLTTIHNQDLTNTYEVSADGGPTIYTKTLGANETLTLPFNAWEPQNNYFFIQENLAAGPNVLVFKADGSAFGDSEPYLDLTDAYAKLGSSDTYDQATGWGGYDVIVMNTKASDGSQGTSYWYELPYGSLVPLATKF